MPGDGLEVAGDEGQPVFEQPREDGLADGAEGNAGEGDAELGGGDAAVQIGLSGRHGPGTPHSLLDQLLDSSLAQGNKCKLNGHEIAVDGDQQRDGEQPEDDQRCPLRPAGPTPETWAQLSGLMWASRSVHFRFAAATGASLPARRAVLLEPGEHLLVPELAVLRPEHPVPLVREVDEAGRHSLPLQGREELVPLADWAAEVEIVLNYEHGRL